VCKGLLAAATKAKAHDDVWSADKGYFSQLVLQAKALKEINRCWPFKCTVSFFFLKNRD
jgi:hypothetical protein